MIIKCTWLDVVNIEPFKNLWRVQLLVEGIHVVLKLVLIVDGSQIDEL